MPRGPGAEAAQDSPPSPVAGSRALSLSIGFPGTRNTFESEFFTLGVQWTDVEPGRTGIDLGVGTLPRVLFEGVLGFGARAALVRPVGLRPGVSAHRFAGAGETIWLLELGVAMRGESR